MLQLQIEKPEKRYCKTSYKVLNKIKKQLITLGFLSIMMRAKIQKIATILIMKNIEKMKILTKEHICQRLDFKIL